MTSRAPFCEGIEGPLHFLEPKSVDNPSRSFSVASRLGLFVTSVLLAVQPGDNLLSPAHDQGRGVVGVITLADMQSSGGQLCEWEWPLPSVKS